MCPYQTQVINHSHLRRTGNLISMMLTPRSHFNHHLQCFWSNIHWIFLHLRHVLRPRRRTFNLWRAFFKSCSLYFVVTSLHIISVLPHQHLECAYKAYMQHWLLTSSLQEHKNNIPHCHIVLASYVHVVGTRISPRTLVKVVVH